MHDHHQTAAVALAVLGVATMDVVEIAVEQIVVHVVVHRTTTSSSSADQNGNARSTARVAATGSRATTGIRRGGFCLCDIDFYSICDDTGRGNAGVLQLDVAVD